MSLILATGSNSGERISYLQEAIFYLKKELNFVAESRVYESKAVDYLNQPDFLNQVLHFSLPRYMSPEGTMNFLLDIEKKIGRTRGIPKGPRVIDIDILFWAFNKINKPNLEIPHPRLFERSFVVRPFSELEIFKDYSTKFNFPDQFSTEAYPYE